MLKFLAKFLPVIVHDLANAVLEMIAEKAKNKILQNNNQDGETK